MDDSARTELQKKLSLAIETIYENCDNDILNEELEEIKEVDSTCEDTTDENRNMHF